MKPAAAGTSAPKTPQADAAMGSEYMDARSYLKQPVRKPRAKSSVEGGGVNDSDFGSPKSDEK